MSENLTRIAVFYDGIFYQNTNSHLSNQYRIFSVIRFKKTHEIVLTAISENFDIDTKNCSIVDKRHFQGRDSAPETEPQTESWRRAALENEAQTHGVTLRHLPVGPAGKEKGIDVLLAIDAMELALRREIDCFVLFSGDSDFIPLVERLKSYGIRVVVIGADFCCEQHGKPTETRTSSGLINLDFAPDGDLPSGGVV